MILSIREINLLKKVSRITGTDYEIYDEDKVTTDTVMYAIEDLVDVIERLEDKIEDLEEDIKDNYRPLTHKELINYRESDFY